MMPSEDSLSSRIEILRFPLIVGVVFIHTYAEKVHPYGLLGVAYTGFWVEFVKSFISSGVAVVAVPLFFLISGYLFFAGEWSRERYLGKLKRRFHTLLIPFAFWNLATLAIDLAIYSNPQTKGYFDKFFMQGVYSRSLLKNIGDWLGITSNWPVSIQFWFIRDLMVLAVLSPVIHFLLTRKSALPILIALFVLWLPLPDPHFWQESMEASFYFCLGAYLSQTGKDVTFLDKFGPWISTIFLGLLIFHSALQNNPLCFRKLFIIFGVPSVWWLAGLAIRTNMLKSLLINLSSASFFVFAAHLLFLKLMLKISYRLLLPTSATAVLALYFLIPLCVIALLVALYHCLLNVMPSFLGFITGSSYRPYKQRA
jgi:fucose 4-O-acetylase-like acetyltransferase